MGVPAHDERDFEFAKKYDLPIRQVTDVAGKTYSMEAWADWYGDKQQGVAIQSGKYDGLAFKAAVDAVAADLAAKGLGEKKTTWRLRDWGVSRQRYWGTPIPIIHCEEHGAVPVPEKDLPVVLPQDCVPDGSGNPLHKHAGFHAGVTCPVCGKAARRETDTMDTFVDSSWYFMRYCDPKNDEKMVAEGADYWMPMDQYIGGVEHAVLHLLYARFWTKVMRDMGLVKFDEPFIKLMTQGMVLNQIFYRRDEKGGKHYYPPSEVVPEHDAQGHIIGGSHAEGGKLEYGGVGKMGKSERNGVDPQDLIDKYGADTARLYTMVTAPPEATLEWNDAGVEGSYRFLRRVWNFGVKLDAMNLGAAHARPQRAGEQFDKETQALRREIHTVLKQIDYDYQRMQYNTVVSGSMKLLNALENVAPTLGTDVSSLPPEGALRLRPGKAGSAVPAGEDGAPQRAVDAGLAFALREGMGILLRCLYPATPHVAHTLWSDLGFATDHGELLDAPWPEVDPAALVQEEIELVLQINGKLRGAVTVPAGADKATIEAAALATEAFVKQAAGAPAKKVIVVPGRLVNIVI
ncbi:MAG: class I tRNA ligase family protein, partial [Polaromonas sp.]|nr:class I tRNA ligase family protein [Polaromonas sp.]